MKTPKRPISRRRFIQRTCAATAFMAVSPRVLGQNGAPPSDRLNLAIVGAGGRGADVLSQCDSENIVALCDVDDSRAEKMFNRYESAPKYKDFRVLLDKQKEIDAVIVATPDHTHAVVALNAIQRGKHVYVEKPLAHTIHEVRVLQEAANEAKVQTQVGNQGRSSNEIRQLCEWIQHGVIGDVKEVHAWFTGSYGDGAPRPADTPPIPETLDWDLWLGPATYRSYHPRYLPGKWRYWFEFGTGVLGDWVCHILDPAFWALNLDAPVSILAKNSGGEYSPEQFARQSDIEYRFPANGKRPPVKVIWTYGKKADIPQLQGVELEDWNAKAGAILIGEKGSIVHGSHGAGNLRILPESRAAEFQKPPESIPRVPLGHQQDWIRACKDGKPASSPFSYGGPLSELALLGVIATVLDGEELQWNPQEARFTNHDKANRFLQSEYRQGWTL